MKLGVLGTGMAGHAIGTKLVQMGQDVMMGSRSSTNEKAAAWVKANGPKASQGTFADAAKFGEILFNCTHGMASLDALKLAGAENMKGKILIDLADIGSARGAEQLLPLWLRLVGALGTANFNLKIVK